METASPAAPIIYLDRDTEESAEFRAALARRRPVIACHDLNEALTCLRERPTTLALMDTATLMDSPASLVAGIEKLRAQGRAGLVTSQEIHEFIDRLGEWGLLQVAVKTPPVNEFELDLFLRMIAEPASGFGLVSWLHSTIQMFSVRVNSLESKTQSIEQVINHFATCGFEVHELYDVRLILEEVTNNAFFHAFRTATGEEKYSIQEFVKLGPNESVRIEYGSDSRTVGFSVTDSAGSLPVSTVLKKLERQLNHQGVFDESGRGLYLSRHLASKLVINIERGACTQIIALFDMDRKGKRLKPFYVNYIDGARG